MTSPASLPSPLIPLNALEATIETVGGKGANLVKLANAGFPIPNGFLIPTAAYHEFVAQNELMPVIEQALQGLDFASPDDLAAASDTIRTQFTRGVISPGLTAALEIGWRWLGTHPVAVRSSATAEDLARSILCRAARHLSEYHRRRSIAQSGRGLLVILVDRAGD